VTRTVVDTSVVVPATQSWHVHHDRALAGLAAASGPGGRLVLPVTVLVQSFSVLTRLPPQYRMPPQGALDVLVDAFEGRADIVPSSSGNPWRVLRAAVDAGAVGGGIHDFEILDAAVQAHADRLLTLNPEDFIRFGDRGVEIVEP